MSHSPPVDQRIVDDYFHLSSRRATKSIAWLYGMLATYGIKPEQLKDGWSWCGDSILLASKKRPIRPLHPQWVLLFQLKENWSQKKLCSWDQLCLSLYSAMAYQEVRHNVTDLLLAYRIRKAYYRGIKSKQQAPAELLALS